MILNQYGTWAVTCGSDTDEIGRPKVKAAKVRVGRVGEVVDGSKTQTFTHESGICVRSTNGKGCICLGVELSY